MDDPLYNRRSLFSTNPIFKTCLQTSLQSVQRHKTLLLSSVYVSFVVTPRTSIIQLKTGDDPICKLKALSPESVQNWVTRIQSLTTQDTPTPSLEYMVHDSRRRSPLHIETETESEKLKPPVYPTPVGKRDYDISASSLRQKVLNKKGKDYSSETASTIQKEYRTSKSTREAILEAHKQSRSATNILEAEER